MIGRIVLLLPVSLLACGSVEIAPPPLDCSAGFHAVAGACVVEEIYFEGGTFTMGRGYCDPIEDHEADVESGACELGDRPHEVHVEPFYLDATEFTEGMLCEPGPCVGPDSFYNAHGVYSGGGASQMAKQQELCARFGKVLADEAQWEFAASGGGTRTYPWGEEAPTCALADDNGCTSQGMRVAEQPPSPEGVYDLAGHLPELVAPAPYAYGEGYPAPPQHVKCPSGFCDNPDGCFCDYDGLRGGGFDSGASSSPLALRAAHRSTAYERSYGLRCARSP